MKRHNVIKDLLVIKQKKNIYFLKILAKTDDNESCLVITGSRQYKKQKR